MVAIEKQQSRPRQAGVLMTGFGFGLMVGTVAALRLPYEIVTVGRWQRALFGAVKAKDTKARSVAYVQARLPDLPLTWGRRRKPHDGLADAACLALWAGASCDTR